MRKNAQMNVKGHFSQPCFVALHVAMRNTSQDDLAHPFHDGRQGAVKNAGFRVVSPLDLFWSFTWLSGTLLL